MKLPTIGVLTGWPAFTGLAKTGYLNTVLEGISAAASRGQANLLIAGGLDVAPTGDINGWRAAAPVLTSTIDFLPVGHWNTDGLIVVSPVFSPENQAYIDRLVADGFPVVFIGYTPDRACVTVDSAEGLRLAVRHLVEHGHERIAFIAGPESAMSDGPERLAHFRAAMQAEGLPVLPDLIAYGNHLRQDGAAAMRQIIERGKDFTAVIASNDLSAVGALDTLRQFGRRVPADVAVIGFDDGIESREEIPPLTTIHAPIFELGQAAFHFALDILAGKSPPKVINKLPIRLVTRRSCGCRYDLAPHLPEDHEAAVEAIFSETHYLTREEVSRLYARLVASSPQANEFENVLLATVQTTAARGDDPHIWHTMLSALARTGVSSAVIDRGRILISEAMRRLYYRSVRTHEAIPTEVERLTARLLSALTLDDVLELLRAGMKSLGLGEIDLFLFEPEDGEAAYWSLWQRGSQPVTPQRFPSRAFPPPALMTDAISPFQITLLPLAFSSTETNFGYVSIRGEFPPPYVGMIVYHLASALRTVQFYQQALEGRRLAESADQQKSRFLSMVSHELRTPLSLIVGLADLLNQNVRVNAPISEATMNDLEQMWSAARHLDDLIRDVLDLATSQVGELRLHYEWINLVEEFESFSVIGESLARLKGLDWEVDLPAADDPPRALVDRGRIRQVILNLINNAVRFTAQGSIRLRLEVDGRWFLITVSDTGIGIPQHEQQLIFDEFQQSQRTSGLGYGGLGLGLAICKRIVELHGGQITVQSSGVEGEGSAFTVRLPTAEIRALEQAAPPRRPSETVSTPETTRPYTLLVIDDEPALLDVTVRMLQSRGDGYHMVQAGGGRSGLEVLRTQPVDLVLLDLMMPEIDGFAVMRAMHDDPALRAIPILVMTAHVLSETEIEHMTRSVTAILSKGVFSSEEILAHVDAALTGEQVIGGQTQRIVRRAMAYIHQHYVDAITREDIAQHVAVDQSYLSRSFQRELGIPPMTYLSRYRIALARNKLLETDLTVMEIALDVGFSSDMAFSHAFRREMGVSPSAYRQQGRKRAP